MPSSAPVTSAATHPRTANTRGRPRIAWNSISSPAMKNSRTIPNLARAGRIPSIGCTSPIPLGPIATPRSSSITTIDNPKRALAKPTSGAIAAAARDTKMGGRGFRRMHPRLKARWRNQASVCRALPNANGESGIRSCNRPDQKRVCSLIAARTASSRSVRPVSTHWISPVKRNQGVM